MISKEKHKKHGNITRASFGKFGRNETAILGTTCEDVQQIATLVRSLFPEKEIAFADADHSEVVTDFSGTYLHTKGNHITLSTDEVNNEYAYRIHLSQADLILVNGNHFEAASQIIVCNPNKESSLRKRSAQLTNIKAFFLQENQTELPAYIKEIVSDYKAIPVIRLSDKDEVHSFFQSAFFVAPPLKALILAGGRSTRMGKDKAAIKHHDEEQFLHLKKMLDDMSIENFISCRADQEEFYRTYSCDVIADKVSDLGPLGGVVSAFMKYPDSAWLVMACDIPLLDKTVLSELINQRNPANTATCFKSPFDGFPEPLIAVWEPKSYMRIMEFVALGYDCPRKVLINTNAYIIEPAQPEKLMNVNTPDELRSLQK